MAFKLGKERRDIKDSSNVKMSSGSFNLNKVKLVSTPLEKGTIAEARNDGTIAINPDVNFNSALMKKTIKHEMKHMQDIESGRADYGENWVMWEGKVYIRKTEDGISVIDGPNGRWPEGHKNHPWEKEAIAAEKQ